MNCEIIAVGSELLSPYRQDTNSLFLTDRLLQLGVNVVFKTIVGDRLGHLTSAIRIALGRTDIVITMGGLGPTEDDLTRQAVAEALGIRLRRHPEIVGALYARFAARRGDAPKAADARPLFEPPQFTLVLPNARTRNGVGQTVKDLSEDPYAGADVTLTLTAKDEAGNEGRSDIRCNRFVAFGGAFGRETVQA